MEEQSRVSGESLVARFRVTLFRRIYFTQSSVVVPKWHLTISFVRRSFHAFQQFRSLMRLVETQYKEPLWQRSLQVVAQFKHKTRKRNAKASCSKLLDRDSASINRVVELGQPLCLTCVYYIYSERSSAGT